MKDRGEIRSQGPPSSPSSSCPPTPPASSGENTISSSSSHSSSSKGGARVTTIPTFVSRRKVRTAGVARSSWKSRLTVGARGRFRSRAFLALLHNSFICVAQARKLASIVIWLGGRDLPLEVLSVHRVGIPLGRPLDVGVGCLIVFYSLMGWGPPDGDGAPSFDQKPFELDDAPGQRLVGSGTIHQNLLGCCLGVGEMV